jgi:uncharacterized membrane protein YgcG
VNEKNRHDCHFHDNLTMVFTLLAAFAIIVISVGIISHTTVLAVDEPFRVSQNTPTDTITNKINTFALYDNPNLGIQFQYPVDWQKEEKSNRIAFIAPTENPGDRRLTSIAISLFPVGTVSFFPSRDMSFNELVDKTVGYLEQSKTNFNLIESKKITLNGNQAHMLVYNYTPQNNPLIKSLAVLMRNGDNMYIISYFAEPAKYLVYTPIVQQMLNSVDVTTAGPILGKSTGNDNGIGDRHGDNNNNNDKGGGGNGGGGNGGGGNGGGGNGGGGNGQGKVDLPGGGETGETN